MPSKLNNKDPLPPVFLNICISIFSFAVTIFFLVMASKVSTWGWAFFYAVLFSFSNNTIFSLLHESVHKSFSKNEFVNDFFGRISAAFFPTGFLLQRGFHLGHHRRNRTDAEMFDLYYVHDNKWIKYFQWYCILLGPYWFSVPLAALLYLFWPAFFSFSIFKQKNQFGYQSGAEEMFSSVAKEKKPILARLEIIYSILFQVGLFLIFELTWERLLLCYWVFGLNWGALQYADHAWTKRDIRYGAWNLKIPSFIRLIFLNYHIHHAHHSHPRIPWKYLPNYIDASAPNPSFFKIYFKMWLGPKPATEPNPKPLDKSFLNELEN